jgi:hypothetical protein
VNQSDPWSRHISIMSSRKIRRSSIFVVGLRREDAQGNGMDHAGCLAGSNGEVRGGNC